MKIALVHELLTMRGGAERVFKVLADMFPDAPIYTLLYDEKKLGDWFPKDRVRPSSLQRLATRYSLLTTHSFNHHLYLAKFPSAVEAWDFSEFDLVLSTSSAFVHGIITNGNPKHISYIHSPARYLWDRTHDVLADAVRGFFGPLKRAYLERAFHRLRIWDAEAADRADRLLAASKVVQRRIQLYWRRESEVVYPPIDDSWLAEAQSSKLKAPAFAKASAGRQSSNYYLVVSTLARYKRIDLAILAANARKVPLKIVGEGTEYKRLRSLAGPTVQFLGYVPHEELKKLYADARATIFPGDEDFGLVPLESLACGTPVIAFRAGGALETLTEGDTAEFFDEPTLQSLQAAMEKLEQKTYASEACRTQAKKFSRAQFEAGIKKAIAEVMSTK
ncbi:MAG: glycosyltransferase [Candidatus Peribacteraceae bacterium]